MGGRIRLGPCLFLAAPHAAQLDNHWGRRNTQTALSAIQARCDGSARAEVPAGSAGRSDSRPVSHACIHCLAAHTLKPPLPSLPAPQVTQHARCLLNVSVDAPPPGAKQPPALKTILAGAMVADAASSDIAAIRLDEQDQWDLSG